MRNCCQDAASVDGSLPCPLAGKVLSGETRSQAREPISVQFPGKSSRGDPICKPSKWAICAATSSRFPEPAKQPKYCRSLAFASAESRRDLKAILRAVWHMWSIWFLLGLHRDCPKTRHIPIPAVPAPVAEPLPWLARRFENRYDQRLWHGRRKSGCLPPIMCRCSMGTACTLPSLVDCPQTNREHWGSFINSEPGSGMLILLEFSRQVHGFGGDADSETLQALHAMLRVPRSWNRIWAPGGHEDSPERTNTGTYKSHLIRVSLLDSHCD